MGSSISDWEPLQSALHFERLCQHLVETRMMVSEAQVAFHQNSGALFKLLPDVFMKMATSDDIASQDTLHPHIFEVMYALVELAAVVLAKQQEYKTLLDLLSLNNLLEALSVVFDSSSHFYKSRGENNRRVITVFSQKRDSVLRVPGFFVKFFGDTSGQIHKYCARKGMQSVGKGCDCCRPAPEADAMLVNLTWFFAHACGFDQILRMLSVFRFQSLLTVDLLLRPLVHLLEYNVESKCWRRLVEYTEAGFNKRVKIEFKTTCIHACSDLIRYLDELVRAEDFSPCPNFETENADQWIFSDVLRQVHSIACCSESYYNGSKDFERVRATILKTQEKMWERMLDAEWFSMAYTSIGAAMEASLVPSPRTPMLSLEWLKEKNVVLKLLSVGYKMKNVPKVIHFVKICAKKKGIVMLEQKDFIAVMKNLGTCSSSPHLAILRTDADDLIGAAMLEYLDLSAYTSDFFDFALNWLEGRKVESAIGSRVFYVLRKLFVYDKDKKWGKRFINSLWKHAASIPENELVDCFSSVVEHYTSDSEIESLKKAFPTSEEQSKLLQDCNIADSIPCILDDNGGAVNRTKLYGQIAKNWEEREANLHLLTSSNLANIFAIVPCARQDIASECFERLFLAGQLTRGLSTDGFNTLASAMTSALVPEFQTLEVLQKESVLHCEVVRQVQKLDENHVREYKSMRKEQHERFVKFFQACRKEKEDVILKALYQKAKVMASVKKAMIGREVKLSSTDILERMLHKAEGAFKEIGNKYMESSQRLPNDECVVCMTKFSLKRKRACLDPCGHASSCVDCATQEWKRSKSCPLCKINIEKPFALPHKLFF